MAKNKKEQGPKKGKDQKPDSKPKPKEGEQLELINVSPLNMKKIIPLGRALMSIIKERVALTSQETNAREALRAAIGEAKIKRLPDGSIKFRCDGMLITIIPTDEKIKVKEEEG